jgi:MFS transporter, MHS family, proline/betaine transporter
MAPAIPIWGLLVGPIGWYIRRHVQETPEFVEITPVRAPVREVFSAATLRFLLGTGSCSDPTAAGSALRPGWMGWRADSR